MKLAIRQKMIVVWFLLTIFVIPFVLRPLHIHHEEEITSLMEEGTEDSSHSHHCDTCLLCQSLFSFFISSDKIEVTVLSIVTGYLFPFYQESGYPVITHHFSSRAPPVA